MNKIWHKINSTILIFLIALSSFSHVSYGMLRSSIDSGTSSGEEKSASYESSGSSGDQSWSQSSQGPFKGSFIEYLESKGSLRRFQEHQKGDESWREQLRKEYIEDIGTLVLKNFHANEKNIKTLCQKVSRPVDMAEVLDCVASIAKDAFPREIFKGTNAHTIGVYRHSFCQKYLIEIQKACLSFSINSPVTKLELEQHYNNKVKAGGEGSSRVDAYWPEQGEVYDFKNGSAKITKKDIENWQRNLPYYKNHRAIQVDEE